MELRVLGPIEVKVDGADVTPTSPSQRIVLATLAAQPGRSVRIDTLIDALWGDDPPPTAERTLRSYVSRLRGAVGSCIVASGGGFSLRTDDLRIDSSEFERQVAAARLMEPRAAADALGSALGLWSGPAFGETADLEPIRPHAYALERLRVDARRLRAEMLRRAGDQAQAAADAESLLAEAPLDEQAWETLIRALSGAGRTAEALHAYRRAYDALTDAGLEPSERLRKAQSDAYDAPPAAEPEPAPSPESTASGHPLLGRDDDLAALAAILDTEPLVTIVGPGGVGKTALAHEVARQRAGSHAGGARVVELAAIDDPSAVPDAVVTALGLAGDGGDALAVLRRARSLDAVVLMDNCEHLLDPVCDVLGALLGPGRTRLRVIATSRQLLDMPAERAWPLAPLDCSGPDAPAQRYFRHRADASRPGSVSPADVSAADDELVTRIVRRLDGLPLAIELAAAQVASLGVGDVADQIDASMAAQPALAQLSRRGGEPRHRTLQAAIAWSEQRLPYDAQQALRQWTVFAGPVSLADGRAVLGVSPETIAELARRSLLSVETRSGRTRYRMLQTVRAVVGDASESTRHSHLTHFAGAAADAATRLETPDEPAAHARIVELLDELRSAHAHARRTDVEAAVRLSMCLHRFGVSRLHAEVLGWAAKLVPLVQDRPELRAAVDSSLAYRAVIAEQLDTAEQRARSALGGEADGPTRCRALEALSDRALFTGDLDGAVRLARQLADAGRRGGDVYCELMGLVAVAMALAYDGKHDAAREAMRAAGARFAGAALSPTQRSWLAYMHGEVLLDQDPPAALASFESAIDLAEEVGSNYAAGVARLSAVTLQSRHSSASAALPRYADVMERWLDTGSWSHLLTAMRNLVPVLADVGADAAAARLLGSVTRADHTPTYGAEAERLAAAASQLADRLGTAVFDAERALGGSQDLATSAREAVAAIRTLSASLQPVEPEDVQVERG